MAKGGSSGQRLDAAKLQAQTSFCSSTGGGSLECIPAEDNREVNATIDVAVTESIESVKTSPRGWPWSRTGEMCSHDMLRYTPPDFGAFAHPVATGEEVLLEAPQRCP